MTPSSCQGVVDEPGKKKCQEMLTLSAVSASLARTSWYPARFMTACVSRRTVAGVVVRSATLDRAKYLLRSERAIDDRNRREAPQQHACEQRPILDQHVRWTSPASLAVHEVEVPEQSIDRKRRCQHHPFGAEVCVCFRARAVDDVGDHRGRGHYTDHLIEQVRVVLLQNAAVSACAP